MYLKISLQTNVHTAQCTAMYSIWQLKQVFIIVILYVYIEFVKLWFLLLLERREILYGPGGIFGPHGPFRQDMGTWSITELIIVDVWVELGTRDNV